MANESGFTKLLMAGIVVLALVLAIFPGGVGRVMTDDTGTISVSGDSKKEVAPDLAKVFVKVTTLDKESKVSQSNNAKAVSDVIAALERSGVKRADIETSSYTLQQKYEYNPSSQKSEFVGYETVEVLQVTTTDVEGVGAIIDTAVGAGANGVDSVSFELKKETKDALTKELLGQAAIVAKAKADTMATSLGVRLDGVKSASESIYFPVYARAGAEIAKDTTQILPQKLTVTASMSITYEIDD